MIISDEMLYSQAGKARDMWLSTLPQEEEVPEHEFSAHFKKDMKRLLKEQRRSPRVNQTLRFVRRAVAAVLIVAVFSFSTAMAVNAEFREHVIEVVVRVYHDLTEYRFVSSQEELEVLPELVYGYFPEGMVEKERETQDDFERITYARDDGAFIVIMRDQLISNDSYQTILNTENSKYEVFYINGEEAFANTNEGNSTVLWTHEHILFTLRSNLPIDELKKIAMEIK